MKVDAATVCFVYTSYNDLDIPMLGQAFVFKMYNLR